MKKLIIALSLLLFSSTVGADQSSYETQFRASGFIDGNVLAINTNVNEVTEIPLPPGLANKGYQCFINNKLSKPGGLIMQFIGCTDGTILFSAAAACFKDKPMYDGDSLTMSSNSVSVTFKMECATQAQQRPSSKTIRF